MANSKKRCPNCNKYNKIEDALHINNRAYCNNQCLMEYANKNRANPKFIAKAARFKQKERQEKLKTRAEWIKEAQAACNSYIRVRDSGLPCHSCDASPALKRGGTMDAGHYRSRGSSPQLRFNTLNIVSQCVRCNRYLSGNSAEMRLGLIRRFGIDVVTRLESDNAPRKFTIEYLKRIKDIFNRKRRLYERKFRSQE